jgi:putative DNA methylase
VFPEVFTTVMTPKAAELIADRYRHNGSSAEAEAFFYDGFVRFLRAARSQLLPEYPIAIIYALKQSELGPTKSSGWEVFLQSLLDAGLQITATWPIRTTTPTRMIGLGTNALASAICVVCRPTPEKREEIGRVELRRLLRSELPPALRILHASNIAPVDLEQASIGPGMAVFSRFARVREADGSVLSVRAVLQLINEALDEYLAESEGELDPDTRFAITWYEQHGWDDGPFGDAENIARARNVSVKGVAEAGICKSGGGKVRILKRAEMRPTDYDPATDKTPTVWEFTQHLIRNLEDEGEEAAARLLNKLGARAGSAKELAYRLYNTCERKKWAEDARSYNGLIVAWPELEKLAAKVGDETAAEPVGKPGKKGAKKKSVKGQKDLFGGDDE